MTILNFLAKTIDFYFTYFPRKRPDKEAISQTYLIAHRGAHDKGQQIIENTHPAFARALALGCWGIELDVRATADGVLVVNHDATLARVWGKNFAIKELSFKNLQQLAPELPSLAEVVKRYGKKLHLFIELKDPFHAETALKEALQALTPCEDYHLLSLNEPLFASLTSFPPEAMLLVALHHNFNQFCKQSLQKHYGGVLGHYLLLNDRKIKQLASAKQAVGVGFVDSKFGLYRELNRGLHWIFSNNVARLCECLEELRG
jgi:glycerophosphoryl diester phosphodiesterase